MTFKIWGNEDLTRNVLTGVDLPSITSLPNGGHVVMWLDGGVRFAYQIYNGNGDKVTAQPLFIAGVSQETPRFAEVKAIGTNGNFAITWSEGGVSNVSLHSRIFNASGQAISETSTLATGTGKSGAQMASNDSGGWATAYIEAGNVKLAEYSESGTLGTQVDLFTAGGSTVLDIAHLGNSKYIIVYQSNNGPIAKVVQNGVAGAEFDLGNAAVVDVVGLRSPETGQLNGEYVVVEDLGASIIAQRYNVNSRS
jgi:hypothetical protein